MKGEREYMSGIKDTNNVRGYSTLRIICRLEDRTMNAAMILNYVLQGSNAVVTAWWIRRRLRRSKNSFIIPKRKRE